MSPFEQNKITQAARGLSVGRDDGGAALRFLPCKRGGPGRNRQ